MSRENGKIEVVRGSLSGERAEQILDFWARESTLSEAAARDRLGQVVCVLTNREGEVAGVNSAYEAGVELIGGRSLWMYRSLLPGAAAESWEAMVHAAYKALDAEFDPAADTPIGLGLVVGDRAEMERRPLAEWVWPRFLYAGYLGDGRQLRVRYFAGARIGEPRAVDDYSPALDRSYRIELFAEQDAVSRDDVVELWTKEAAMPAEEARRRVDEVLLVATGEGGELVGIATAYLQHSAKLAMSLWHMRAFVTEAHRASRVGWSLMIVTRDHLQARFVSGQDTRAGGLAMEVENEMIKRFFDYAHWQPSDFAFVGENERGDHVRVHYFPGAVAPEPPA